MSIYKACSAACRELASKGEPFIDIDVVNQAAQDGWSERNFREAQRHANQICGTEYRGGRIVRYGPVTFEGEKDYVRKAGRVLYAGAETGPEIFSTPNGEFPQIHDRDDPLSRVGRRRGTRRDDLTPWDEQNPDAIRDDGMMVDGRPLHREIERLRAELKAANNRVQELETESQRLREGKVAASANGKGSVVPKQLIEDAVLEALSALDVEARLTRLEEVEQRRARMYADAA